MLSQFASRYADVFKISTDSYQLSGIDFSAILKNVISFRQFKKDILVSFPQVHSHEKDVFWLNVFHHIAYFAHGPPPTILFVENGSKDLREFFSKVRAISVGILNVIFQNILSVDNILTGNVFYFGTHKVIKYEVHSRFDDFQINDCNEISMNKNVSRKLNAIFCKATQFVSLF